MTKPLSPKNGQRIHIVIPDTQVRPGVSTKFLDWIGKFIRDEYQGTNLAIIHLGDHWDMPSLSSYDKGKKTMEGRRVKEDIKAGNVAFAKLSSYLDWCDEKYFLVGNHEFRIVKASEDNAQIDGLLDLSLLDTQDWEVFPFLEVLKLNGVLYSHYFVNNGNGRPLGGLADTRLKYIGQSFTQGHQQGLQVANRAVLGKRTRAIIAGSCYSHSEDYRGPQGRDEWKGILVCHNVADGDYDLCEVSLDYLKKRYYTR